MDDHMYDLVAKILSKKLFVKAPERSKMVKRAYKICYTKKYVVNNVWNPITEATEERLIFKRSKAILLRKSELEPMIVKVHEKLGTWSQSKILDFLDGRVAIAMSTLRDIIAKNRGPFLPKYLSQKIND